MGRKRKSLPIIENVDVIAAGAKGKAVAKVDGLVLFVQGAVPGDTANVQLTKKRKGRAEGRMVELVHPSPYRVEPTCVHFGTCGGCKWQHLAYEEQLQQKRQQVIDVLTRIAQVDFPEVRNTIGSTDQLRYRNKLEFTFGSNRWFTVEELESLGEITDRNALGFHMSGSFEKILQIDECHLQPEPSNAIRNFVNEFARNEGLTFYNIRENHGFLRNLTIRTSTLGEVMVLLAVAQNRPDRIEVVLTALKNRFPEISSLLYVINEKKNDTIWDQRVICYHGADHIIERLNNGVRDLDFRIGPKSFFQTNPVQAEVLYRTALELASPLSSDIVYDLYCGTGSISLFVADHVTKVVGIELVPEAISDAWENARQNKVSNTHFIAGDMKDLFTDTMISEHGKPDIIITDPPRAGMHKDVVEQLITVAAPKIVYISCDPATQARDIGLLGEKYAVTAVQPVDMFPHTHHVENIILLELKN